MNYKKRRIQKTINKNDAKVRRAQAEMDRPTLGAVYGEVRQLTVQLDFFNQQGHQLLQQTRKFSQSDGVDFAVSCPGRCGNGRMDLEGKLRGMVERRETSGRGGALCPEQLSADIKDLCGCELRCQIQISYQD